MDKSRPIYLVITSLFPSLESFRGPYIYDQVKAIERDGRFKVVVLKPTSWMKQEKDYQYEGVNVYCFTHFELPSNVWPGFGDMLSCSSLSRCLTRLGIMLQDIAVVHSHVTSTAKYANYLKKCNSKIITVLQHHGYDVLQLTDGRFAGKDWHKKLSTRYGIEQCKHIDLHIGVSKEILKYLENFPKIQIKKKLVLYNGVDTSKFFHKKIHNDEKSKKEFIIGCVANFWELKDQMTLIKAVDILIKHGYDNIRVKFVGTGYTRIRCEQYIQEHGLDLYFEFKNEVDHHLLNDFYNTLDLFVLPSYWDSFGCVYVEAYACGVPFMTAKGTGIIELIPEKDMEKWVIEPKDFIKLSHNIEYYIVHREKQNLKISIDINVLIKDYIDQLNNLIYNE